MPGGKAKRTRQGEAIYVVMLSFCVVNNDIGNI